MDRERKMELVEHMEEHDRMKAALHLALGGGKSPSPEDLKDTQETLKEKLDSQMKEVDKKPTQTMRFPPVEKIPPPSLASCNLTITTWRGLVVSGKFVLFIFVKLEQQLLHTYYLPSKTFLFVDTYHYCQV